MRAPLFAAHLHGHGAPAPPAAPVEPAQSLNTSQNEPAVVNLPAWIWQQPRKPKGAPR